MAQSLNPANPENSGTYTQAQVDAMIEALKPKCDLLWTNPDVTSSFAAQTIELDLSGYDFVLVEAYGVPSSENPVFNAFARVKGCSALEGQLFPEAAMMSCRTFTTSVSQVSFNRAISSKFGQSNSWDTNNDTVIPYQIYGIKL
jgi:hypothetical protein